MSLRLIYLVEHPKGNFGRENVRWFYPYCTSAKIRKDLNWYQLHLAENFSFEVIFRDNVPWQCYLEIEFSFFLRRHTSVHSGFVELMKNERTENRTVKTKKREANSCLMVARDVGGATARKDVESNIEQAFSSSLWIFITEQTVRMSYIPTPNYFYISIWGRTH